MNEVSKEEFFRAIAGPENIHPRSERDRSVWENQRTREVVGISTPGYKFQYSTPSCYMLDREFAARKGIKESQ